MLMPCLLFQEKERCKLTICGGTYVGMSPTVAPLTHVLFPYLRQVGIDVNIETRKHGFFPDVVGETTIDIAAIREPLKPVEMLQRGDLIGIDIHVHTTSGEGKRIYDESFKPKLEGYLAEKPLTFHESESQTPPKSRAATVAVTAVLRYSNATMLSCSVLIEGNSQLHSNQTDYASQLAQQVEALLAADFCVDQYH